MSHERGVIEFENGSRIFFGVDDESGKYQGVLPLMAPKKNKAAQELAKKRVKSQTPERRSEIAKKAAAERWRKEREKWKTK